MKKSQSQDETTSMHSRLTTTTHLLLQHVKYDTESNQLTPSYQADTCTITTDSLSTTTFSAFPYSNPTFPLLLRLYTI